jgi:hypothetical protein
MGGRLATFFHAKQGFRTVQAIPLIRSGEPFDRLRANGDKLGGKCPHPEIPWNRLCRATGIAPLRG